MPTLDFPCASHVLINKEKNSNDSMMMPRVEEEKSSCTEKDNQVNSWRFHNPSTTSDSITIHSPPVKRRSQRPQLQMLKLWFKNPRRAKSSMAHHLVSRTWLVVVVPIFVAFSNISLIIHPGWKPIIVIERCTFRRELFHPWSYRKVHLQMQMMVEVFSSNTRPG